LDGRSPSRSLPAAARSSERPRGYLRKQVARLDLGNTVLLLAAVCTIAALAVAAAILLGHAEQERQALEGRALALARSTAYAAEREVAGAVARLEALSASPALQTGDLPAFRAQLAATPAPEGTWFVVLDEAGRQIANSLLPMDAPLPEPDAIWERQRRVREVIERDRTTVSSVVWAPIARTYATGVTIPARLGPDRRRVLLGAILPTQRLFALVREQHRPPGWRAALLDKSSKVIARIEPAGWLRGSEPPETWSLPLLGGTDEGLLTGADATGEPVVAAFSRSKFSEWIAVVEVPLALLHEPRLVAMRRILLFAGALLAVGAAAAWWLRGRINRSLGALRSSANAADERQRAAEARFRHYWEHTPEGLFVVRVTPDNDFVFEGLNPAHEQATGLRNAAIAGRRPEECLSAEVAASLRSRYRRCAELGVPTRYNHALDLPGGRRDWETCLAPMFDPETGRVMMLFGTCRDVTERRRAEKEVRLNEERLRLAQRAAGAGTWDWDLATGKLHWSAEMYVLFGVDPAEASLGDLHATWLGLIHHEDRCRVEEGLRNAVAHESPFEAEYRLFRGGPGGELRWIASRGRVVDQAGLLPEQELGAKRRMAGVAVDVTERRRAEFAARDTLALLQSSLDALTAQIAILDGAGRIVAVNAAWRRMAEERGAGTRGWLGVDYLDVCGAVRGLRRRQAGSARASVPSRAETPATSGTNTHAPIPPRGRSAGSSFA